MLHSDINRFRLPPGARIFEEGQWGRCAYLIESGRVEISARRGGRQQVLKIYVPGEMFGEMAVIDDIPRSATATALEETELTIITRDQLRTRVERAEPVVRLLLQAILRNFRREQKLVSDRQRETTVQAGGSETGAGLVAEDQSGAIDVIRLEGDLRRAVRQDEFELHYQPIVALETDAIAGFEALIRWHHPERGCVSPDEFIWLAEDTGLIVPIGRWALAEACGDLRRFQAHFKDHFPHLPPLFMSVNLSPGQFQDAEFVDYVRAVLGSTDVLPERVKLEITETLLMDDPELAGAVLHRLKDVGVNLVIDDFGTGYSSLSHIYQFPLDTLKIDRSFVAEMLVDVGSREVVRAICGLSQALSLDIVAEGVETFQQVAQLRDLECAFGQGFLISKPLDAISALRLLERPTWTTGSAAA